MNRPSIVVSAYNRPESLKRLLIRLNHCHYPVGESVELIISIDYSHSNSVNQIASEFDWKHGTKSIRNQKEHLGLKKHILECASLAKEKSSVILFEDDTFPSLHFYLFAQQSIQISSQEEKIAGISLYSYCVAESCGLSFQAIKKDADYYFMQVPSSWGQIWTKKHWEKFEKWLEGEGSKNEGQLPQYVKKWGSNSWKRLFMNYLIQEDKYFLYPYESYSTNLEEAGTNSSTHNLFNVTLVNSSKELIFKNFNECYAIYDAHFEINSGVLNKLSSKLKSYDYEVDLYGQKVVDKEYVLGFASGEPVLGYSNTLLPLIENVINDIEGNDFGLYRLETYESTKIKPNSISSDLLKNEWSNYSDIPSISIVVSFDTEADFDNYKIQYAPGLRIEYIALVPNGLKNKIAEHNFDVLFEYNENPLDELLEVSENIEEDLILLAYSNSEIQFDALSKIISYIKKNDTIKMLNAPINNNKVLPYFRWSDKLAKMDFKRAIDFSLEGFIFRKDSLRNQVNLEMNLLKLLEAFDLYSFEYPIIKNRKSLPTEKYSAKGMFTKFLYSKYLKDENLWRTLFVDMMGIKPILKLDKENQKIYLSQF